MGQITNDEIIYERAPILFGLILRLLCSRANITQDYLEEQGKIHRDKLISERRLPASYQVGSLDQETISRVTTGERLPTRGQVKIWLEVLENTFNSPKYASIRFSRNMVIHTLSPELKADMFHLAGFGSDDEVVDAYNKRIQMATERASSRSTRSTPRKQSVYVSKKNDEFVL